MKEFKKELREETRGHGITGVVLNLSMAHIQSLIKRRKGLIKLLAKINQSEVALAIEIESMIAILDVIIGTIDSEDEKDLWGLQGHSTDEHLPNYYLDSQS